MKFTVFYQLGLRGEKDAQKYFQARKKGFSDSAPGRCQVDEDQAITLLLWESDINELCLEFLGKDYDEQVTEELWNSWHVLFIEGR